ncbi:hypothetical protein TUM4438_10860 [Shewanella sairae]|uniref:Integrase n=1 Tax=Shewanella sairae TaxID=190310 RepID=A0ABQ4P6E7_9GAMM|nr:integrase domain-containing protein [Shewanella sairae]MCL1130519.1 site-specific integrase [Shewanella sairae]GIU42988.1 hypothetical protein TUM4438_10860 [Shewanella sairae]
MKVDKIKKNLQSQSFRFFNQHYNGLGSNKANEPDKLRSHSSFYKHIEKAAFAAEKMGVKRLKHITVELAQKYLEDRREKGICQKSLAFERLMLERILAKLTPDYKLAQVTEIKKTVKPKSESNRAYTQQQVELIMSRQSAYTKLSTEIAFNAGLRAFELLTIRRANEALPSSHRKWRDDLFIGRDGVRYIVTGKGGLSRTVVISHELSQRLEERRLNTPVLIKDRHSKKVLQHYALSGGHKFSRSFSKAAIKTLGWSHGAHGVRFSYAQERMNNGIQGMYHEDKQCIVSQEMGHFRPEIANRYLTP